MEDAIAEITLADRLEAHTEQMANTSWGLTMQEWNVISNDILLAARTLRALDEAQERAEPWTDDDQRGLNAAVADAMWYWDDMPMDPDDAISLTGILKDRLQENGFQIVRAPMEKKP